MQYSGKLYGKIGRAYVPLTMTSKEVDAMQATLEAVHLELSSARGPSHPVTLNHVHAAIKLLQPHLPIDGSTIANSVA